MKWFSMIHLHDVRQDVSPDFIIVIICYVVAHWFLLKCFEGLLAFGFSFNQFYKLLGL